MYLFALANIRGTGAGLTFRGADTQFSKVSFYFNNPLQRVCVFIIMVSDTPTSVQAFLKPLGIFRSHIISNPFTKLATIVSRSNKIGKAFMVGSARNAVISTSSIKIQVLAVLA